MELNEFVNQSIANIMDGIKRASEETGEKFELKNRSIEFDVAVTVTNSMEKSKNIEGSGKIEPKINVFGFDLGSVGASGKADYNKTDSSSNSVVSRLQFAVQVHLATASAIIEKKPAS